MAYKMMVGALFFGSIAAGALINGAYALLPVLGQLFK